MKFSSAHPSPAVRACLRLAVLLGLVATALPTRLSADTYQWIGRENGQMSDPFNWDPSQVPRAGLDTQLVFGQSTRTLVDQNLSDPFGLSTMTFNQVASSYTLSGDAFDFLNSATIQQNSGSTITFNNNLRIGQVGDSGTVLTIGGTGTGNLVLNGNVTDAKDAVFHNTGSLSITGSSLVILKGNNTYTGTTTLQKGILRVGSAGALGGGGTISFGGGTLQYSANNQSDYSDRFSTADNQRYRVDTNGQDITLATGLASSGGSLTKLGDGALTLSGASTYTGNTAINAGGIVLTGSLATADVTLGAGASLEVSSGGRLTNGGGSLTLDGTTAAPATASFASNAASVRNAVTVGDVGEGTLTQTAGTLTLNAGSGNLILGNQAGSSGTYNLQAGRLNAGTISVGQSGAGTFTQTGGSVFTTTADQNGVGLYVGFNQNSSGLYDLQSGRLSTAGGIDVGTYGLGAFRQSGGNVTTNGSFLLLGDVQGSNGTYSFNDGTLTVGRVVGGQGVGVFRFNGGTLIAAADNASFFEGLTTASVQAGGAKIDTAGHSVTVAQNLGSGTGSGTTDGGLTKLGAGSLTLTGASAYTGPTTVSAGTLAVVGALNGAGQVTVADGATLAGTGSIAGTVDVQSGGTLSAGLQGSGTLTLQSSLGLESGSLATFTLSANSSTKLLLGGSLSLDGASLRLDKAVGLSLVVGETFVLVDNTSLSVTLGVFGNAPGGLYTDAAGDTFLISYSANLDGGLLPNDVTARVLGVVPEPSVRTLLGGALGVALVTVRRRVGK